MNTIAERLHKEMEEQDVTIPQLVAGTGMADSTIRNALSDRSKNPAVMTIGPICAYLGVSLDEMLGIKRKTEMRALLDQESIDLIMAGFRKSEVIQSLMAENIRMGRRVKNLQRMCLLLGAFLAAVVIMALVR